MTPSTLRGGAHTRRWTVTVQGDQGQDTARSRSSKGPAEKTLLPAGKGVEGAVKEVSLKEVAVGAKASWLESEDFLWRRQSFLSWRLWLGFGSPDLHSRFVCLVTSNPTEAA